MAVSIMQELAHRARSDEQPAEHGACRGQTIARRRRYCRLTGREPARQLHPPAEGTARLSRSRSRSDPGLGRATCLELGLGNGRPMITCANSSRIEEFMSASAGLPRIPTAYRRPNFSSSATCAIRCRCARKLLGGSDRARSFRPRDWRLRGEPGTRGRAGTIDPTAASAGRNTSQRACHRRGWTRSDTATPGRLARPLPPLPTRQFPIVSMTGTWSEAFSQPRLSR